MSNPATTFGPLAEASFDATDPAVRGSLAEWLQALPCLADGEFRRVAVQAIDEQAAALAGHPLTASLAAFHECRIAALHATAWDRHIRDGHRDGCALQPRVDNLYEQAVAESWRASGLPGGPVAVPCDCKAVAR